MNGAQHYAKGEDYLARAEKAATFQGCDNFAALAQAHFLAAQVAATVMVMGDRQEAAGAGHDQTHLNFYRAIE